MSPESRKLIELDYEKTLSFIDKMDGILFRIKNWAITTNGAIIALAIYNRSKNILVVNFALVLCFWLLELFYKCFHENALKQGILIEDLLSSDSEDEEVEEKRKKYVFGIGHTIQLVHPMRMFAIVFTRFHMTFLYLVLLLVTILAFCFFEILT
jgi:hypothetical protein